MNSSNPFRRKKPTIADSLKWLKYKIEQGQARRAANNKVGAYVSKTEFSFNDTDLPRCSLDSRTNQQYRNKGLAIFHDNTFIRVIIAGLVAAIPISIYLLQNHKPERPASVRGGVLGQAKSLTHEQQPKSINGTAARTSAERSQQRQVGTDISNKKDVVIGGVTGSRMPTETMEQVMHETALEHAAKHAQPNYVCPMHSNIISSDPNAKCPICGMDLVPLESGGKAGILKPSAARCTVVSTVWATSVWMRIIYEPSACVPKDGWNVWWSRPPVKE
jgi:hypothetical protein